MKQRGVLMKKARYFPWPNPDSVYATAGPEYEMAITMEGHTFNVKPIDDCGINTGRRRFEVRCITCKIIVHAGTTGPSCLISQHLDAMINRHLDDIADSNERLRLAAVREQLAAYAHEAWSGWMKYLFSKTYEERCGECGGSDDTVIPDEFVKRWQRQLSTPYVELSESEKESDRAEADKILAIINGAK